MTRLPVSIALVALCTVACSKKDEGGNASTATTSAKDCGTDYADPQKEFCVKVPPGYKPGAPQPGDALISETIEFKGPKGDFTISVGFSSASYKTYEEEMKSDDDTYLKTAATTVKPQGNGATAGGGKWWAFTMSGSKRVVSDTKSNANKVINCSGVVETAPEILEACKSVRAFPK